MDVSTQKESSVLFSLHELMDLERERIEAERAERERTIQAVAEATAAEERRKIEAEYARARAVEDVKRNELERERAESARLEAMKLAEIHRAKADADHWAKLEAARQEHEHVLRLQALRSDKGKRRLLYGIVGAVGLLVASAVAGAVVVARSKADAETARLASEANRREHDSLVAEAERLRQEQTVNAQRYTTAKSETDRLALAREKERIRAEEARIAAEILKHPTVGIPSKPAQKAKANACTCTPGDPLCACQ